jgi:hypothetical protein
MKYTAYVLITLGLLATTNLQDQASASNAQQSEKAMEVLKNERKHLETRLTKIKQILSQPKLSPKDRDDLMTEQRAIDEALGEMEKMLQEMNTVQEGTGPAACPKETPKLKEIQGLIDELVAQEDENLKILEEKSKGFEAMSKAFKDKETSQKGVAQKVSDMLGAWYKRCTTK